MASVTSTRRPRRAALLSRVLIFPQIASLAALLLALQPSASTRKSLTTGGRHWGGLREAFGRTAQDYGKASLRRSHKVDSVYVLTLQLMAA